MFLGMPFMVIILVTCIILLSASKKKASVWIDKKPKKLSVITSDKNTDEVFKKIVKFGQLGKYGIGAIEESKKVIVFEEKANMIHMGFFYPVYVSTENNQTKIEIGTQGKIKEFNSIRNKNHEAFLNSIKVALFEVE